ncbi:hypothetical protein EUGRSUZ_C03961 [Eucalyptus grandis]|uniref:Uncharacterized protein n=2 Tax=Eucalyptus grandis TaxID=71139 RepID=A0ACC3LJN1_EUCGR|nr:hypothetical protein EUGRSUZ_C03961 [Eucalyptus grandis]
MLEVRGVTKRRCNKTTSEERLSEVGYFVEACSSDLSLHLLSLTVSLNQSIVVLRRKESVYRFLINWQRPQGNWKVAISTKHNNLILLLWPKITGMECPEGKSLPLSGESSSSSRRDYEVFLSFRGPDTRLTITDSLYAAMIRAGICVFKDDEELRVGEEIRGELLRAISNSKIYVPIFSENYASSKWCLRELAHMVECRKRDKKLILPIFYGVDASNLKLRTGSYGKALRKHERRFGEDMAKHWEEALIEVAGIKGYNLKDHSQDKLIAFVLEEVFGKLMPMQRNWCDGLVGIHDQMETVMKLLAVDTFDVRFVVIHGMGGIGKTTLVKAIFKRISSQFQSCSFLSDIRESDILNLQKKLLHDILGIQHPKVMDANEGRDVIKQKLGDKKAFIVLDDMDKRDKLMNLAGESSWFGSGSRIIITTRNTYFLAPEIDTLDDNIVPMHLRDFSFHEMKQLQFYHALQLFSKHSFASDSPPQDYIKISHEIVETTGRLPLALEVIGSLLHSKGKKTWKNTLQKLREVPHEDVQKKLLISYKELEYEQQQIFLDIACHCIGEERIPAYYILEEIDSTINQLGHLKCLEISGEVHMPNRDSIPVIRLIPKTIGGLKSLLVLKVEKHDGVIKLPHSIGELFGLKHLSLHKCHNLRELPDSIGDLRSLLHLDLSCTGINALPDSIGRLELLLELALSLTKIVKLPYSIGNLKQLQIMNLSCTKIRELPKSIWILKNLEKLYANNCKNLKGEIPSEISGLSQLKILDLSWTKVHRLPVIMNRLFNLRKLDLWFCMGLQLLPNLPTGLTKLRLVSSSLQAAPNLSNLTNLDYLAISDYDYRCELSIIEQGQILHLNLEWLERLHKLQTLIVVLSNSNMHPIDLSSLSQLEDLEIACTNPRALTGLPSRLVDLTLRDVKIPIEWSMFSNLGNLSRLKFFRCRLREIEFDNVLGQLEILQHVEVSECKMLVRLSNLSSLKEHQVLSVNNCPQLIEIKSEPSSTGDCSSTERPIPDALKLEKLCRLRVVSCKSLQNIPNACHKDVLGCPLLDGFDDQSVVYDRERMGPVDLSGLLDKLWASP